MSDWPQADDATAPLILCSADKDAPFNGYALWANTLFNNTATTWPVASKALFAGVLVKRPMLVRFMAVEVTVQSGNLDVGIYSEAGQRLVSKGATAMAVAGVQTFDIADTWLDPGLYYLACAVDNVTACVRGDNLGIGTQVGRFCAVREMASAYVLPATATYANLVAGFIPYILASEQSVI